MARPLRVQFAGAVYHVMARGNDKALIFLDERDYRRLLELLQEVLTRFSVQCSSYCLMPNHYHLVLTTLQPNLSAAIKHLNGVYTQWWNRRHGRCGHVLQGRFKDQLVQTDRYLLTVCRYVVLNPVRAGLVRHPDRWPWSSFRSASGLAEAGPDLDMRVVYGLLASSRDAHPAEKFRRFVCGPHPAEHATVERLIRSNSRRIGDETFLAGTFLELSGTDHGGISRRQLRPPAPPLWELLQPGRASIAERDRLIRLACRRYGYRIDDVARTAGVHRSTVVRVLGRDGCLEASSDPRP